jgi:hypothetical protein
MFNREVDWAKDMVIKPLSCISPMPAETSNNKQSNHGPYNVFPETDLRQTLKFATHSLHNSDLS